MKDKTIQKEEGRPSYHMTNTAYYIITILCHRSTRWLVLSHVSDINPNATSSMSTTCCRYRTAYRGWLLYRSRMVIYATSLSKIHQGLLVHRHLLWDTCSVGTSMWVVVLVWLWVKNCSHEGLCTLQATNSHPLVTHISSICLHWVCFMQSKRGDAGVNLLSMFSDKTISIQDFIKNLIWP